MTNSSSDAAAFPWTLPGSKETGLTKREWFAGMAMQMIQDKYPPKQVKTIAADIAKAAFNIADAMLAASERGEG